MGKVTILPETTKDPISLIGRCAGVCWGADTEDEDKNYQRGLDCIKQNHGRTLEFPDVYAVIDGYSARVIREWYTHVGGAPTRLQASTRYIEYEGFDYVTPKTIKRNAPAKILYEDIMLEIDVVRKHLVTLGIPTEDVAMILPLGMTTCIMDKRNLRNIQDMSRQRLCSRAYWEFQDLLWDYLDALSDYSPEWAIVVNLCMKPKCEELGYCPEKRSCGRMPKKGES